MAYVGETRARALVASCVAEDFGLLVIRGRVGKAAIEKWPRWVYDNGAFGDWRGGRAFDAATFETDVLAMLDLERRPEWIVLPDVVAGGLASLATSMAWLARLERLSLAFALAVQDGMTPDAIPWGAPFTTIFVGGTTLWKLATAAAWATAAHEHGKACHVGRVGSAQRVRWARAADVDSIDSALPLWSAVNMRLFVSAMRGSVQGAFGWAAPPARDRN